MDSLRFHSNNSREFEKVKESGNIFCYFIVIVQIISKEFCRNYLPEAWNTSEKFGESFIVLLC